MASVTVAEDNPILISVGGIRVPRFFKGELVKQVLEYNPRPGDIFVTTYPKCGTTWLQYILWSLFNLDKIQAGHGVPTLNDLLNKEVPFLEWVGTAPLATLRDPRIMKHHLPFNKSPYHPEAKYVNVVRNPFDCVVSVYHMQKNHGPSAGLPPDYDFDTFFESFMEGDVPFDSYFDHVLSWYAHRNDINVHFMYYEVLLEDTANEILKLADFLDPDGAGRRLRRDGDLLEMVKESTSFQTLKAAALKEAETSVPDGRRTVLGPSILRTFFRKGIVGDWRNHLSPQQVRRLKDVYCRRLGDTEMHDVWYKYLGF